MFYTERHVDVLQHHCKSQRHMIAANSKAVRKGRPDIKPGSVNRHIIIRVCIDAIEKKSAPHKMYPVVTRVVNLA